MESKPSLLSRIGFWIGLGLVILFFMFPLYWILISSIKVRADVITHDLRFIHPLHNICRRIAVAHRKGPSCA